jgi:hypothetical protein
LAVDNVDPAGPPAELTPGAVTDPQHAGDITGALGTLKRGAANSKSWRRLILLFPILFFCQEMVVRLGAVSGVGHGRLIFARFGKFWGTFSVADLFVINAVTVVAEFIGVEQALSLFGMPPAAAVTASAVLLFAVMAGGTYRYWERFLVVLVIANLATFPMIYFAHASIAPTASGAVPSLPGALDATILLLVVAVVGTTVEPWQLFFQQSNVVDKRITSRWMNYERINTGVGVLIEVADALVLMAACAFGLARTSASGNFTDISSTAADLQRHVGHGTGCAIALRVPQTARGGLRAAPHGRAFNPGRRGTAPGRESAAALHWMQRRSLPLTRLEEPQVTPGTGGSDAATGRVPARRRTPSPVSRRCSATPPVTRSNWPAPPRRGIDPRVLEDPPRRECAGSPRLVVEAISSTSSRN